MLKYDMIFLQVQEVIIIIGKKIKHKLGEVNPVETTQVETLPIKAELIRISYTSVSFSK